MAALPRLDEGRADMNLLRSYRREWLRFDLLAGLTTAAVIIPKAMAYATVAGLAVEAGLYTALVPMVIYALLGTSQSLSVSTTTTLAILTAGVLATVAPGSDPRRMVVAAATLAMLVGLFLLLAALLRLGFVANFISDPVLTGFEAGIALVIIVSQLPKLLGVHIDNAPFLRSLLEIIQHLPQTSVPTLCLALVTLALIPGLKRFVPGAPAPLVAVAVGIAAAALLGLKQKGVALTGTIPAGLPGLVKPDLSLVRSLWPAALGIALMSFTESIAAGRSFAEHGEPQLRPNRELTALGLANVVGSFFRIMPAGGGMTQTAVNRGAGARTQVAELVTAAVVLAVILVLSPLISLMPQATLAAVVVAMSAGLLDPREFRAILRVRRTEFWWGLAALAGVVLLGTLQGILVAVALSLMVLLYQANHPAVYALGRKPDTGIFRPQSPQHPGDETIPGLLIVRTEGRLTFASIPQVRERMRTLVLQANPRVLLFDLSAVPDIEYTALKAMIDFEAKLREIGITLWVAALNPSALVVIERSPLGKTLGHERMFRTIPEAVEAYSSTGEASEGERCSPTSVQENRAKGTG
jgi:sulfate permease, SulP family